MRLLAAVSILALAVAAPALAQTDAQTPASPPAAATPAQPATLDPAQLQAKGEAFGARIQAMITEMQAARTAAGSDTARAKTDLDAIQARYQPEADAFATELETFVAAQASQIPDDQRAGFTTGMAQAVSAVRGAPAEARADLEKASVSAAPATAPHQH
ncbi:hypothetical protein [Brevundimonas sp. PAMC22021]|uniref:hypothetical protein n=1 Tax=Brevundimonas sp. PAMC22021 TaxID=2861285 RepID=UPI001C624D55|nr:hypothetical protein [Brevundimonas sp. PAMC22021]QYF86756.1 hypothetical protein KY493_13220 [Brevundimonas sp. PAMC22021]